MSEADTLAPIRAALDVIYGAGAATATRSSRRAAERTLLSLRSAEPSAAMNACVTLMQGSDVAASTFAAQTIAHLCRFREPDSTWPSALLGLLGAAVAGGHSKPVLTQLSLGVCALTARKRAWSAHELVGTVCQQLHAVGPTASAAGFIAALRLLALLPEEMASDRLALSEMHVEELSRELATGGAAAALIELCVQAMQQLGGGGGDGAVAAAALHCLAAWVSASLLPWRLLAPAMQTAMVVTAAPLGGGSGGAAGAAAMAALTADSVSQLEAGCALLTAAATIAPAAAADAGEDVDPNAEYDEAAAAAREAAVADALIGAALGLRGGFASACEAAAAAVAAAAAAGGGGGGGGALEAAQHVTAAAAALASLYAEVGASCRAHVGRHPELLQTLLAAAAHAAPEVGVAALGFWSRAGRAVVAQHGGAAQPLLAALVDACAYPADMGARDGEYWEQKDEVRGAARRVVLALFGEGGGDGEDGGGGDAVPRHALGAAAWLLEATVAEAQTLAATPDPLAPGGGGVPPSPPPEADPLGWQRLEAMLHLVSAMAPALAAAVTAGDGDVARLVASDAVAALIGALGAPQLPARRALWREAATAACALGVAVARAADAAGGGGGGGGGGAERTAALMGACCAATARTLSLAEDGGDDDPFEFVLAPSFGASADETSGSSGSGAGGNGSGGGAASGGGQESVHAGAGALWHLCSGAAAASATLAASPGVFDGVMHAYASEIAAAAASDSAPSPKAACLLKVLCGLARASALPLGDERVRLICAPMVDVWRVWSRLGAAAAAVGGGDGAASAVAGGAAAALRQCTTVACHAGGVRPGVLGVLAAEWATLRAMSLALAPTEAAVARATCRLLSVALRRCHDGAGARALIEASAQLSMELLRCTSGDGARRPPPCVLEPLVAAIKRAFVGRAGGAAAEADDGDGDDGDDDGGEASLAGGAAPEAPPADAALEAGVVAWAEAALGAFVPSLSSGPAMPGGDGSDAVPIDLTDDDDEATGAACAVLSACARSGVPRLCELAATLGLPLLVGPAGGLRLTERVPGQRAIALARHLLLAGAAGAAGGGGPAAASLHRMLHDEGGGAALALALLNAAGGAMPSYLHDEVAEACRALYAHQPGPAGPGHGAWVHAAVASAAFSHERVGAGGGAANYAMVLGYLAEHGAWDHFATVVVRGVLVSEAEDQGDFDDDDAAAD